MSLKNYYFFDEQECKFVPVEYDSLERIIYNASLWILCGIVLAGSSIATLSSVAGTPAEITLRAENRALVERLKQTRQEINQLDNRVHKIAKTDNEIYRSVLGMEPISYGERQAGVGGSDPYANYDIYQESTAEILKWTSSELENLERRINIQKNSFKELKAYYNKNQKKMKHIPAIRPVNGIMLSGFGMRYHPVLKYRRMHDGLDFRANVGTEVHATGDGVVKYASRKGTFGLLLVIDHGFGLETYYAHLSAIKKGIEPGTKIKRGELVAYSGNSGVTEGPHLHYEVHRNSKAIDPLNFLFADITPDEFAMYQDIARNNPKSLD